MPAPRTKDCPYCDEGVGKYQKTKPRPTPSGKVAIIDIYRCTSCNKTFRARR